MGRTVKLHPAVIVVALAAGGVLGGIVGVFLAVRPRGSCPSCSSTRATEPAPDSPLLDDTEATASDPPAGEAAGEA